MKQRAGESTPDRLGKLNVVIDEVIADMARESAATARSLGMTGKLCLSDDHAAEVEAS